MLRVIAFMLVLVLLSCTCVLIVKNDSFGAFGMGALAVVVLGMLCVVFPQE